MADDDRASAESGEIRKERNVARFCVENRQITWVLLLGTVIWGAYSYVTMPKRKDPEFPTLVTAIVTPWRGVTADKIEEQVTRKIEQKVSENLRVKRTESISQSNLSIVYVTLEDDEKDPHKQWDDIDLKLKSITDLPDGAGPITYLKDFGDTAALMLTVASPQASPAEIAWRAGEARKAIDAARSRLPQAERVAGLLFFPTSIGPEIPSRGRDRLIAFAKQSGVGHDVVPIDGPGFVGVDGDFGSDPKVLTDFMDDFFRNRVRPSELHLDVWPAVFIRNTKDAEAQVAAHAGERYSLRQLDEFTALIQRTLQGVPPVNKVSRAGVVPERIFLEYSQQRLAGFGIQPVSLQKILQARNTTQPGGLLEEGGKNTLIDPSGAFKSPQEIGGVVVASTDRGLPVYLREGVDIYKGYESPPTYLNYFNARDSKGQWRRTRAITLAIDMRSGRQIADFGRQVDAALAELKKTLPEDLILARTSDQPLQVKENVGLFMQSLYEAIVLVVFVAFVGFWEWRSAVLIAFSIPLTLAMTFGFMHLLNVDIQQVSIASLIIALGLLVDDPVVAGDAIKREMDEGQARLISAWLGPTKIAKAILFATITNIVAYLPLLLISSNTGAFIRALPIVVTCALVASRIASMTFVPLLGYYLLRAPKKTVKTMEERRTQGFAGLYYKLGSALIEHRKLAFLASLLVLAAGYYFIANLRLVFFPKDRSHLSFADVWLPEDANIAMTDEAARNAERVIRDAAAEFGKQHPDKNGHPREVLDSVTTFVGGGGPRFWFSVAPELLQPNYAQIIVQATDPEDTERLIVPLQQALSHVPGARIDMRQLETGQPIGVPVQIRLSGEDDRLLRQYAERVKVILRADPDAVRIRDDWGAASFSVKLKVDSDRANLAGISNEDVAVSSAGGMSGLPLTTLRNGDEDIPVMSRLRLGDRATLSDVEDLYVYSLNGTQRVPLRQISTISYQMGAEKIRRRNQFRSITIACYPTPNVYPSEVMNKIRPELTKFERALPAGYTMQIGGEEEERLKGFKEVNTVLMVSVVLIFLSLVVQFRSAFKPAIVFAAIPYGMVGALAGLSLMNAPFGFIAYLGMVSLVGVIVSHVIVLFDFIEEKRGEGMPLQAALLDAGILRLRPVMITVGATVIALVPLALHGGPLWEPLCYSQIGGLTVATFVTLLLVPVMYSIFVLDLKLVKWEKDTP
ncbi:MAG: efflux RND transporter permease subunit [Bryobacteraceae bacterium]|jgi:multidrug efflux pump subunit AcrB